MFSTMVWCTSAVHERAAAESGGGKMVCGSIMNHHGNKRRELDSVINSFLAGTQIGVPICFTEWPQLSSLAAELWIPCCPLRHQGLDTHTHRQGLIYTHHTQRPTHCLNLLRRAHTHTETHIHTDIDTHRDPHTTSTHST